MSVNDFNIKTKCPKCGHEEILLYGAKKISCTNCQYFGPIETTHKCSDFIKYMGKRWFLVLSHDSIQIQYCPFCGEDLEH